MSGAVRAGWVPSTGPDAPAPNRRWLRWLLAATVAWAVLLAGLTWLSVRDDPPTVREQRSLGEAGPVVDRAVGELAAAAGAGSVLELVPPRIDRGCRVTPFADGATLRRAVTVLAPTGTEQAVLDRIADRLPADWRAGVRRTPDGPRLSADAGEFVAVEGGPTGDGRVRLTADTGCRPVGSGYTPAPVAADGPEVAALSAAARALGQPVPPTPELVRAPCPGGAVARTAWSVAAPGPAAPAGPLGALTDGTPLLDAPPVYAYRAGPVTVLAELTPDAARLTATVACPS
ncbi:hypothetical protein ACFOW4_02955 [Micromonospora sp. GCM10011542]|uniref:hypothetical protein n=1 Tax=Micromonospora sp. GCM10011542 TaxID=3317337 RepID=UPI003607A1ED